MYTVWKRQFLRQANSICRQFNLISRAASASLKMPWVVNWSLRPLCEAPPHPNLAAKSDSMFLQSLNWKFPANRSFPSLVSRTEKQRRREWIPSLGFTLLPVYRGYSLFTVPLCWPPSPPLPSPTIAPPLLPKKCTRLRAASQHCTSSQNVNCKFLSP